ncbi:MAG: hypothetical protein AAF725_24875 [Acidobacteriota bacterium]
MARKPPSPFTVSEVGEPGALRAVADFTCPKCSRHTRFTPHQERPDGGFSCPHCGLVVKIRGATLSDYQRQLDEVNASLADFTHRVKRQVKKVADGLAAESDGDATDGPEEPPADEPPTVH